MAGCAFTICTGAAAETTTAAAAAAALPDTTSVGLLCTLWCAGAFASAGGSRSLADIHDGQWLCAMRDSVERAAGSIEVAGIECAQISRVAISGGHDNDDADDDHDDETSRALVAVPAPAPCADHTATLYVGWSDGTSASTYTIPE